MKEPYIKVENNIALLLNKELKHLSDQQEQETNQLRQKIMLLEEEVLRYKNRYEMLKRTVELNDEKVTSNDSHSEKELNVFFVDYAFQHERVEVMDDMFQLMDKQMTTEQAVYHQLRVIDLLMQQQRTKLIAPCLERVIANLRLTNSFDEEWIPLIKELLKKIFEDGFLHVEEVEDMYVHAFKLIQHFSDQPLCEQLFRSFLEEEAEVVIANSMDINSTYVIDELLLTYFLYELGGVVEQIIDQVIEEWKFIDTQLTIGQYVRMLWYAFYFNRDEDILGQSEESAGYLQENIPEVKLYSLYYDLLNHQQAPNQEMKQLMDQVSLFRNLEKAWLFDQLEYNLKNIEREASTVTKVVGNKSQTTNRFLNEPMHVLPDKESEPLLKAIKRLPNKGFFQSTVKRTIKEQTVKLAVYQDPFTHHPHDYEVIKVLYSKEKNEWYVTKSHIRNVKKKVNNPTLWIEIHHLDKDGLFVKAERVKLFQLDRNVPQQPNQEAFKWPTTEIKDSTDTIESLDFSTKSELRELGYQITGLTRAKRWDILSGKAVPTLGLKKVAYTIAFLVRGRKAMKNGLIRNQHSITEWEYDLDKLKAHYYKKDFVWPRTDLKG
ncbi:hypothetical protein [Metabacillus iocasae]|uniref:Uncharacterized protein n=1 Tax=Priestia iocasae TaxID=2291674 RepID=A0ABS2QWQ1_9BACI|nr:hypothetical protein [Metabacillus iocasae]MBM7702919.1 hypothetical protein [Metabacillus iocasae]